MNNLVKFKLIFVTNKKKDGSEYTKMVTILKDGDKDVWVDLKFGESVNEKQFKGVNQIVTADINDVRLPISLEPYTNKEGKTKYPYVWVEKIVKAEKLVYSGNTKPRAVTQDAFSMDDESTEPISADNDSQDMPF